MSLSHTVDAIRHDFEDVLQPPVWADSVRLLQNESPSHGPQSGILYNLSSEPDLELHFNWPVISEFLVLQLPSRMRLTLSQDTQDPFFKEQEGVSPLLIFIVQPSNVIVDYTDTDTLVDTTSYHQLQQDLLGEDDITQVHYQKKGGHLHHRTNVVYYDPTARTPIIENHLMNGSIRSLPGPFWTT